MEVYEAVRKRVACRSFSPQPVPLTTVLKILRAGAMAPSAENNQPWEFILIRGPEVRRRLTDVKVESRKKILRKMFPDLGNEEIEGRAQRNRIALETASWLVAICYKDMDNPDEIGELRISLSHAAAWTCIGYIWLAATAEGIGLSPTFYPHDVYDEVKQILRLPRGYELAAILRVGHPIKKPLGRKKTVVGVEKKIYLEHFGGQMPNSVSPN